MTVDVPQAILDALTDVAMPRLLPERAPSEAMDVGGHPVPVHRHGCVVVGSGAAGLRAAVELQPPRRRRCDRQPERLGRHLGLLRLRQADAAHRQHRRPRRRLQGDGPGDPRRRGDGRGHRLCRGRRLLAGDGVASISRPASAAGPARRNAALPDRPRRGRPRHQLRAAHLAADGEGAGRRGDPARHSVLQSHDGREDPDRGRRLRTPSLRRPDPPARSKPTRQPLRPRRSSSARSSSSRPAARASSIATASIPTAASAPWDWRSTPASSWST